MGTCWSKNQELGVNSTTYCLNLIRSVPVTIKNEAIVNLKIEYFYFPSLSYFRPIFIMF